MNRLHKEYLRDLLILTVISLAVGIYLIATAVFISKDGVLYIEKAQNIGSDTEDVLAERPSGYELMIQAGHRIVNAAAGATSTQSWIWTGQSISLICRTAAIAALYFTGCMLVGRRGSFWGCMILLLLPEPAHIGSDVLREWPALFFMSAGMLCLVYGIIAKRAWVFAINGLLGGIAFAIRPESAYLLVISAVIVAVFALTAGKKQRYRWAGAFVLMAAGFAIPYLVYAALSGQPTTEYLQDYQEEVKSVFTEPSPVPAKNNPGRISENVSIGRFFYEFFKDAGEIMMWYFLPFWIMGVYLYMRANKEPFISFVICAIIIISTAMILFRFMQVEPVVSERWILPPIALTFFCIYAGIECFAGWLLSIFKGLRISRVQGGIILTVIGILICLPKLIEPLRADKKLYIEVSNWIRSNTSETDSFGTFDTRIPFYAGRPYKKYNEAAKKFPRRIKAEYLIARSEKGKLLIEIPAGAAEKAAFSGEKEKVIIYRMNP